MAPKKCEDSIVFTRIKTLHNKCMLYMNVTPLRSRTISDFRIRFRGTRRCSPGANRLGDRSLMTREIKWWQKNIIKDPLFHANPPQKIKTLHNKCMSYLNVTLLRSRAISDFGIRFRGTRRCSPGCFSLICCKTSFSVG